MLLLACWMLLASGAEARQTASDTLLAAPLAEVMGLRKPDGERQEVVAIASRKVQRSREAPGIVTVIEREEILACGARDLIDVLRLVPGFTFHTDVQGVTGLGVRGNWAHEGKVLLLLNGLPMNEILYGTSYFGNRFPMACIERIEIIRGPGSAIYGGFAELGVINVITLGGGDVAGAQVASTYGQQDAHFGRANLSALFGKKGEDYSVDVLAYAGAANRGTGEFSDFYGSSFELAGEAGRLAPSMVQLRAEYRGLQASFLRENYRLNNRTAFYINTPKATHYQFVNQSLQLGYNLPLGEKASLQAQAQWLAQQPYHSPEEASFRLVQDDPDAYAGIYYAAEARRLTASLVATYDPTDKLGFYAGAVLMADKADLSAEIGSLYGGVSKVVRYRNVAAFAQGLYQSALGNITVGARLEEHSNFGTAFAPRVALTRVWEKWHAKILFSRAFRSPSIENIQLAPERGVVPERTGVVELEAGYRPSARFSVTANLFDIYIKDPIVYFYDDSGERYENFGRVGTRGGEVEARYSAGKWQVRVNYAYSRVSENTVPLYGIPKAGVFLEAGFSEEELQDRTRLAGMPAHQWGGYATWKPSDRLWLNASCSYVGERYGFYGVDEDDVSLAKAFAPVLLANFQAYFPKLWLEGLSCSLGVNDALGQRYLFLQPYNGYHAPLPGPAREWVLRLVYAW
jgi:outer membrane cobalamin receptor